MKKYINYIACAMLATSLTSCHDWLTEDTPGTTKLKEAFTSLDVATEFANGVYVPLEWEYNGKTYYPEWFIGDVVSDDALKGGQYLQDMAVVRDMENFKTTTDNQLLLGYYRAQWQGIARANLAIQEIPDTRINEGEEATLTRLVGECKFLRAYYYFRLCRVFGGMPLVDFVVDSDSKWHQERSSQDATYAFILKDLEDAEAVLPLKSKYPAADLGRATKGAAQAMLMKVNLYRGGFLAQSGNAEAAKACYEEAVKWGKKVVESNEYDLDGAYFTNFLLKGENDKESVFEIQYTEDPTSDYGEDGDGSTRGTFTLILQRSRSKHFGQTGWGFNKPTENLFNEYEPNDPRRDETIWRPAEGEMDTPAQEIYLDDSLCNRKYAMYTDGTNGGSYYLTHDSRGPLNNKQIRYSDVLLMYAEACCEIGDLPTAKWALKKVRDRVGLPAFPYTAIIQGKSVTYQDNQEDLRKAIRHERRVELAMEGHRWFDLCRWGIAKETMDAYLAGESTEAQAESAPFIKGKHELFPIPAEEIAITGIEQNPNY